MLDGVLADINGDGFVERAEITQYGFDGLEVVAVKEKAEPLFSVLVNWGEDDWDFRLQDRDGDGISDIELGPQTADGFKPKVVFRWDAAKRSHSSPAGEAGALSRAEGAKAMGRIEPTKGAPTDVPLGAALLVITGRPNTFELIEARWSILRILSSLLN